jgi:membrane protease YdiL (CAAX protease family)
MNPFDDIPGSAGAPEQPPADDGKTPDDLASRIVVHPSEPVTPLSPFGEPPPPVPCFLPRDLQIGWSWLHLLLFGVFAVGTLFFIQLAVVLYYAAGRHLTQKQMEQIFESRPELAVGSNVVWFFLIFLFLYVTLAVLRDRPFWSTLGWKKLDPQAKAPANPWLYFAGGVGLAIGVAMASSQMKTPEHLPIQDLFKSRTGALMLMSMAVFIAPLIEETVFRGYLYPLFASSFSRWAAKSGSDPVRAVRTGTVSGVLLTGALFGFLHGAQLGWTKGLVIMLIIVGTIFTFARARSGTVLASFLLHLGYNSMIALSAVVETHGFTRMPPHP